VFDQKMRRPRARYGSLKSKPWERMGISRRTWYRMRVTQIVPVIDNNINNLQADCAIVPAISSNISTLHEHCANCANNSEQYQLDIPPIVPPQVYINNLSSIDNLSKRNAIEDKKEKDKENKVLRAREDFCQFWEAYPRKHDRKKAFIAFQKAITKTNLQIILNSLQAYKDNKPNYQDFKLAATWLNGECWNDVWDAKFSPQSVSRPLSPRDQRYMEQREIINELYRQGGSSRATGNEMRSEGSSELGSTDLGSMASGEVLDGVFRRVG